MEHKRIKVLLIEDNYDHVYMVRRMLEKSGSPGYYLKCVDRLFKGIEEFSRQDFDVILLDLSLPDSHGLDSLRKINDLFMGGMPIVVMSALDDEAATQKAVQEGAQDYLIKGQIDRALLSRSLRYAVERHKMRRDLRRLRRDWENIFHSIGNPTVILDLENNITMANQAALNEADRPLKDLLGKKCYQLFHCTDRPIKDCPMKRSLNSKRCELKEVYLEALDKTFLITCTPILNEVSEIEKVIHAATDITERKRVEEQLRYEAIHDSLTGVYNRRHLMANLATAIHSAKRHRYPLSVCLCDLDDFKSINYLCAAAHK